MSAKDKLERRTKQLSILISNGKKITRANAENYLELLKNAFGDNEASGFLNLMLASMKIRKNQEPEDEQWLQHFLSYKSMPKNQQKLVDSLADALLTQS